MLKKIFFIIGTRPEAIKMAPLVEKFKQHPEKYQTFVCVTGQHREMLDQIINWFKIKVDYNLDLMENNQLIADLTINALKGIEKILIREKPDLVFVQGDTTSAFTGSLASFYQKIPIAHVEAGLRTGNKYNPYPEEINRVLISRLADLHFASTKSAAQNLYNENIPKNKIFITGNTVIDALFMTLKKYDKKKLIIKNRKINLTKKFILVTTHRRESFGQPLKNICLALKDLIVKHKLAAEIIIPVHLNPNVQKTIYSLLGKIQGIHLIPPLDYQTFVNVMAKSYLILTDSGGIQEEAPSLGKPVLVLRENTERPEGIHAGTSKLIGTDKNSIVKEVINLFNSQQIYNKMAQAVNPYGDGKSADRIIKIVDNFFK